MLTRSFIVGLMVAVLPSVVGAQTSLTVNRVKWVSAADTDTKNCTALRDTLAAISGSASNSYLVKLEPGVYACGTNTVSVPSFTAIEGAG